MLLMLSQFLSILSVHLEELNDWQEKFFPEKQDKTIINVNRCSSQMPVGWAEKWKDESFWSQNEEYNLRFLPVVLGLLDFSVLRCQRESEREIKRERARETLETAA